jgi:hypothetical protein
MGSTEDLDTTQDWDDFADALRYLMHNAFVYPGPEYMVEHKAGLLPSVVNMPVDDYGREVVNTSNRKMDEKEFLDMVFDHGTCSRNPDRFRKASVSVYKQREESQSYARF